MNTDQALEDGGAGGFSIRPQMLQNEEVCRSLKRKRWAMVSQE